MFWMKRAVFILKTSVISQYMKRKLHLSAKFLMKETSAFSEDWSRFQSHAVMTATAKMEKFSHLKSWTRQARYNIPCGIMMYILSALLI